MSRVEARRQNEETENEVTVVVNWLPGEGNGDNRVRLVTRQKEVKKKLN